MPADVLFDPCAKRSGVHEPVTAPTALLRAVASIAPFLVESRLSLGEHVVGEVREPVRAVHALAGVAAFGLDRDGGAVLLEHRVQVALSGAARILGVGVLDAHGRVEGLLETSFASTAPLW